MALLDRPQRSIRITWPQVAAHSSDVVRNPLSPESRPAMESRRTRGGARGIRAVGLSGTASNGLRPERPVLEAPSPVAPDRL
ncbi:hypothetical protein CSOJ01_07174 [Colletotrichum sojae]|uniref:Uncharacterized protein n=1 Tax=Colletotrichum sojae TaxID=2175907 RepID=A0A8H6JA84_9PEZI|nr:hypothetical protein CSOJ01_07174 [Colletotrichum sojae]